MAIATFTWCTAATPRRTTVIGQVHGAFHPRLLDHDRSVARRVFAPDPDLLPQCVRRHRDAVPGRSRLQHRHLEHLLRDGIRVRNDVDRLQVLIVFDERIRADVQQQLDDPLEMIHGREMKRRVAIQILLIDRDAELYQHAGRLVEMLLVAHPMRVVRVQHAAVQRRVAFAVLQVHLKKIHQRI